ncbi:MAG: hypothetical protein QXV69_07440 [Sulfolobaceae archaeon]
MRTLPSKLIDHVKKEVNGIHVFVLNKIFSEIDAKGNRNRYLASLILFT